MELHKKGTKLLPKSFDGITKKPLSRAIYTHNLKNYERDSMQEINS